MAKTAQNPSGNGERCSNCTHSQYLYHASAYGVAAEIERPVKQSIHSQAATVLPTLGGRGGDRVQNFHEAPFVSFDDAYTAVGGSFDACHNMHTTYATAVVEGLNVFDVVTADRVVSHMVIYAYGRDGDEGEPSYDITGSHFDNLKVAGHPYDVKLPTSDIHKHEKYSSFVDAIQSRQGQQFLPWGDKSADDIERLEGQYHALSGLAERVRQWGRGQKAGQGGMVYRAAAAGKPDVNKPGLTCFGNIILVPKFGVVRLAEMIIHPYFRYLTMVHVQMCSGTYGGANGGGAGGGGGMGG